MSNGIPTKIITRYFVNVESCALNGYGKQNFPIVNGKKKPSRKTDISPFSDLPQAI